MSAIWAVLSECEDRHPDGGSNGLAEHFEHPNDEAAYFAHLLFVGGGAVESGDGDFVEAEVDAELSAVVDEVVEEHGPIEDGSGAFGDDFFSPA